MKRNNARIRKCLLAVAAVLCGAWLLLRRYGLRLETLRLSPGAASIGVIGGADGPTAIFVTGSSGLNRILLAGALLLAGLAALYFVRRRKK